MRLLHTTKLYFEEFFESSIPVYAILSHRWEEAEVSFQDFEQGKKRHGAGYLKILNCCTLARSQGYEWVWIDTCYIDTKSSAELSEAINSMYRWYANAKICYAYLSDVQVQTVNGRRAVLGFEKSKWFMRGWTLQELLAPNQVLFLDNKWKTIGTKNKFSFHEGENLSERLSKITGIPEEALRGRFYPWDFAESRLSVAQRMSWAAARKTSRIEDMAYCLLGIFGVNMPLLYGEGKKAFLRLQQEILKKSHDESIFAWSLPQAEKYHRSSLFARSPNYFTKPGNVERLSRPSWIEDSSYLLTDEGVQMDVFLVPRFDEEKERWLLPLNCGTQGRRNVVVLSRLSGNFYQKVCSGEMNFVNRASPEQDLIQWAEANHMRRQPFCCSRAQHSSDLTSTVLTKEKRKYRGKGVLTPLHRELRQLLNRGGIGAVRSKTQVGEERMYEQAEHEEEIISSLFSARRTQIVHLVSASKET
jgi:Heterokaryon incompatibility protein (HET)